MSGGRGTSKHTCTACGRTVVLTQRPDYGADYVCHRCKAYQRLGLTRPPEDGFPYDAQLVDPYRLYDARVEDQKGQP